jgi:hypothetical protein
MSPNGFGIYIKQQMKEYYTVKELSKEYKLTSRNIRKVINNMSNNTSKDLLYKDKNNQWRIHHILKQRFKPKRKMKSRYYALSVDLCRKYRDDDIHEIMRFVVNYMNDPLIEVNYTIEKKHANGNSHLHCFINCKQKRKFIQTIRLAFSSISYKEESIFDLSGWKDYITKDSTEITVLKTQNHENNFD